MNRQSLFLFKIFCCCFFPRTFSLLISQNILKDTKYVEKEYDFVIVGGGSAGSVMANRLSEVRDWKILLLEAGGIDSKFTSIPVTAPFLLLSGYNWAYKSEPNPNECLQHQNHMCGVNPGRVLGGSSVINWLIHTRGCRQDYDDWEKLGNKGWNYWNILSYFKKLEMTKINTYINLNYRGTQGPVHIESPKYISPLLEPFLKAGEELGYSNNDPNAESALGFSNIQATMFNGIRHSAAEAYIRPAMNRSNLVISLNSYVTKIVIDHISFRAVGVEYFKNRRKYFIKARKEVILAAGAIKSPQILMLSGIGPAKHLREFNVPVIRDLKVGYNHQEHIFMPGLTFIVNSSVTLGTFDNFNPLNFLTYIKNHEGPLTLPGGVQGIGFVKTNNSITGTGQPDIEILLNPNGLNRMNYKLFSILTGYAYEPIRKYFNSISNQFTFNMYPVLLKPKSRGRIKLKSKNPNAPPSIHLNFAQDQNDLKTLIEGIRMVIKLGESKPFMKYNTQFYRKHFPGCEKYVFNTDQYWKCSIRNYAFSLQHHSGTCKMGPITDFEAVVNHELKVHGVKGLRVVDASIFPTIPAAHTNAVVYMVAEKAADMIKKDWLKQFSTKAFTRNYYS